MSSADSEAACETRKDKISLRETCSDVTRYRGVPLNRREPRLSVLRFSAAAWFDPRLMADSQGDGSPRIAKFYQKATGRELQRWRESGTLVRPHSGIATARG
jgi:hypothetical protein